MTTMIFSKLLAKLLVLQCMYLGRKGGTMKAKKTGTTN